jgi:membrane protein insertase Oxa1/YidC/SpoIIIJ
MELFLVLKILFIIAVIIALYAVARNLDIIKIILIYWKDLILGRK